MYGLSANEISPLEILPANFTINTLLGFDETTGALSGEAITLSSAIDLAGTFQIYAGFNRAVIVANSGTFFDIDLPSGVVTNLGTHTHPNASISEAEASYGVAEFFGGELYVDYATHDPNTAEPIINRMKVSDGTIKTIATLNPDFNDLHEFSVLPGAGRWYFHYENSIPENLGFADATFRTSASITSNGGGDEASVAISENASLATTVAAIGSADLDFEIVTDASGPDGAKFMIDGNGVLSFVPTADAESPRQCRRRQCLRRPGQGLGMTW